MLYAKQKHEGYYRKRSRSLKLRRAAIIAIALLAVLALDRLGVFSKPIKPDLEKYHGQTFSVLRTIDGDTIDLDTPDNIARMACTRIRLWGVDTPETIKPDTPVQHFGPEASEFTKNACLNKKVRVELISHDTRDKYKRLLAYIYLPNGKLLNAELIAQGFGYADPRYDHPKKAEFKILQSNAKSKKLGLWKNLTQEDKPHYMQR